MTFAGVSRHIGVLESAGLVRREVRGREHWLSLQPDGLTMAQQWIDEQTDFWSTRADALSARLRRKGAHDDRSGDRPRATRHARCARSGVRRMAGSESR